MAEKVLVKGKVKWAQRLFVPDEYNGKTTWSVQFYPEDVEVFYNLQRQGMKNVIKKDDDGYNLKISRPTERDTKKGKITFTPPKVTDIDNEKISSVDNDSKVEMILDVYEHNVPGSTKKAKAIRLESVKVLEAPPPRPVTDEDSF